jgi:hypothetical protein
MQSSTTPRAVSTTKILDLIHRGSARQKIDPNPSLKKLVDSAVSVLVLNLRVSQALVTPEQADIVDKLAEYLKSTIEADNIHT